jgi:hypothetical protein
MLLTVLIIFFTSIILYKILFFIGTSFKLIEGMEEYKQYDTNDPMILAQQNAGNIEYLKSRMTDVENVKGDVVTMKQDMQTMQIQMDGLVQQQADMATELSGGGEPIELDGLDDGNEEEAENEEDVDNE